MQYTANFSLRKPEYTDILDVADLNFNVDVIDAAFGDFLPLSGGTMSGGITLPNNIRLSGLLTSGSARMLATYDPDDYASFGSYSSGVKGIYLSLPASADGIFRRTSSSTKYQILDTENAVSLHDHRQLYREGSAQTVTLYIIAQGTALCTDADDKLTLGIASRRFNTIYSSSGTINTSDAREKRDITDIEQAKALVMAMQPRQYKFNDGERTHYGFIAQEFEGAMAQAGIDDCAALIKGPLMEDATYSPDMSEDEYRYGLRYDELIAPLLAVVQEQQRQVEAIATRLDEMEAKVN